MRGFAVIFFVAISCSLVMSRPNEDVKLKGDFDVDLPEVSSSVADDGESFGNSLLSGVNSFWGRLKGKANDLEESFNKHFIKPLENAVEKVKDTIDHYTEDLISNTADLRKVAKHTADGVNLKLRPAKPETNIHYDGSNGASHGLEDRVNGLANSAVQKVKHAADNLEKDLKLDINNGLKLEAPIKPEANAHHDDTINILPGNEDKLNDLKEVLKNGIDKSKSAVEDLISNGANIGNGAVEKVKHAADDLEKGLKLDVNNGLKLEAPTADNVEQDLKLDIKNGLQLEAPTKPEANAHHDDTIKVLPGNEDKVNDLKAVLKNGLDKSKSAVEDLISNGTNLANGAMEKVKHAADDLEKDLKLDVNNGLEAPTKPEANPHHDDNIKFLSGNEDNVNDLKGVLKNGIDKSKSAVEDLISNGANLVNGAVENFKHAPDDLEKDLKLDVNNGLKLEAPIKSEANAHHDDTIDVLPGNEDKVNDLKEVLKNGIDKSKSVAEDLISNSANIANGAVEKVKHAADNPEKDLKLDISNGFKLEAPTKPEANTHHDDTINVLPGTEDKVNDLKEFLKNGVDKSKIAVEDLIANGGNLANDAMEKVKHAADDLDKDLKLDVNSALKLEASTKPEEKAQHDDTINVLPGNEDNVNDLKEVLKNGTDKSKSAVEDLISNGANLANGAVENFKHAPDDLEKDLKLDVNNGLKLEALTEPEANAHHDDTINVLPGYEDKVNDLKEVFKNGIDTSKSAVEDLISNGANLANDAMEKVKHAADDLEKDLKLDVNNGLKLEASTKPEANAHHDDTINVLPGNEDNVNDLKEVLKNGIDKSKSAVEDLISNGANLPNGAVENFKHAPDDLEKDLKLDVNNGLKLEALTKPEANSHHDDTINVLPGYEDKVNDLKEVLKNGIDTSNSAVEDLISNGANLANGAMEKVKHAGDDLEKDLKLDVNNGLKLEAPIKPEANAHHDDTIKILPGNEDKLNDLKEVLKNGIDKSKSAVEDLISNGANLANDTMEKVKHAADDLEKDLKLDVNNGLKLEASTKPEANAHHDDTINVLPGYEDKVNDLKEVLKNGIDTSKSAVEDLISNGANLANGAMEKVKHVGDDLEKDLKLDVNSGLKLEAPTKPEANAHQNDTIKVLPGNEDKVNDLKAVLKNGLDKSKSAVEDLISNGANLANGALEKVKHAADDLEKDLKLDISNGLKLEAPTKSEANTHHDDTINVLPGTEDKVNDLKKVLRNGVDKSKSAVEDLISNGANLANGAIEKVKHAADDLEKDLKLDVNNGLNLEATTKPEANTHHDDTINVLPGTEDKVNDLKKVLKNGVDKSKSAVEDLNSNGANLANGAMEKAKYADDDLEKDLKLDVNNGLKLEGPTKPEANVDHDDTASATQGLEDILKNLKDVLENSVDKIKSAVEDLKSSSASLVNKALEKAKQAADEKDLNSDLNNDLKLKANKAETSAHYGGTTGGPSKEVEQKVIGIKDVLKNDGDKSKKTAKKLNMQLLVAINI